MAKKGFGIPDSGFRNPEKKSRQKQETPPLSPFIKGGKREIDYQPLRGSERK
jgi:hypothetical protein